MMTSDVNPKPSEDSAAKKTSSKLKKHGEGKDAAMLVENVRFNEHSMQSPGAPMTHQAASVSANPARSQFEKPQVDQRAGITNVTPKNAAANRSSKAPAGSPSERIIVEAMRREFWYGLVGLLLGMTSIIGGVVLGIRGVVGATSWSARLLGLESSINDAAPGVVLFIVGLFMIVATKPRYVLRRLQDVK